MPKKQTIERVRRDKREGKSASTKAGEFVAKRSRRFAKVTRARSDQAGNCHWSLEGEARWREIACSQEGQRPRGNSAKAMQDLEKGEEQTKRQTVAEAFGKPSLKALNVKAARLPSKQALSRHARAAARKRSPAERSASDQERLREPAESSGALELIEGQRRKLVDTFHALHRRAAPAISRVVLGDGFRRKAFPAHRGAEALLARVGDRRLAQARLQRTRSSRPADCVDLGSLVAAVLLEG